MKFFDQLNKLLPKVTITECSLRGWREGERERMSNRVQPGLVGSVVVASGSLYASGLW